jgi:HlyD family secretion protein
VINFEVRILLKTPDNVELRPGMSMSADIETETHTNVLAVPIQSVTVRAPKMEAKPEESGEAAVRMAGNGPEQKLDEVVFVVDEGTVKTVTVKRGLTSETHVEVTGEELEGKEVVAGPFKAINRELENGSKVKVENRNANKPGSSPSITKN